MKVFPVNNLEDTRWMHLALAEAARGRGRVEPNPIVGSVIVRDNQAIGIGHHARFGGAHAEVAALANCAESPRGATIHVTLEPCCHHGKTPPCVDAILEAGLKRVVIATPDPFPKVNGGGILRLREAGVEVEVWPEASEIHQQALELNRPFFKKVYTGKPYVIAKWAMSLDGRIALASGDSRWISSEKSRALVHDLRGRMDAIIVGIGTALADNPSLTARPPGPRTPLRVVVAPRAELPLESHLAQTSKEIATMVACLTSADQGKVRQLEAAGCQMMRLAPDISGSINANDLLDRLGAMGLSNVLVEGGSRLLGRFFDSGAIDEVQVYIAPTLFGGPAAYPPIQGREQALMEHIPRLKNLRRVHIGDDTLLIGQLNAWPDHPAS